jgi:hypothetical protein
VRGQGVFTPYELEANIIYSFSRSSAEPPTGMLVYEAGGSASLLSAEIVRKDLAAGEMARSLESAQQCLQQVTTWLCDLAVAHQPHRTVRNRLDTRELLSPQTAEGELRYILTLVAESNSHMAGVLASGSAELAVLKAAARKNRACRSRMHYGSYNWQERVKNVNRSARFMSMTQLALGAYVA